MKYMSTFVEHITGSNNELLSLQPAPNGSTLNFYRMTGKILQKAKLPERI